MRYHITFNGKQIGTLALRADGFSVDTITVTSHRKALQQILEACYAQGLSGGIERDGEREEALKPEDPRFPIELSLRLHTLGYVLA